MYKKKWLNNSIIVCCIASFCCALWGSAFPLIKIGYQILNITPQEINSQILFAGTRFTLAGVLTILISSIWCKRILLPSSHSWFMIFNLGLYQTVIQYVLFYIGISNTTGVKASIVEGTNVFVALLIASLLFHQEKLTKKKILGCIIGFIGVIIINLNKSGLNMDFKMIGEGFVFLSTVAYAFSSVMLKQYSEKENPIILSGYQFIIGGAAMMMVGFLMGGKIGVYTGKSVGLLIYLAMVSAVAYALWGILMKYNPISKVAIYGFMTPIFGVILSAIMLNEKESLGIKSIVSLLLVSIGIYIVNFKEQKNDAIDSL